MQASLTKNVSINLKVIWEEAASPPRMADLLIAVAQNRSTVFARWTISNYYTVPLDPPDRPTTLNGISIKSAAFSTIHVRYQRTDRQIDRPTDRTDTELRL